MLTTVLPVLQAAASGVDQGAAGRGWLDPVFLSFVAFGGLQLVVFLRLLRSSRRSDEER